MIEQHQDSPKSNWKNCYLQEKHSLIIEINSSWQHQLGLRLILNNGMEIAVLDGWFRRHCPSCIFLYDMIAWCRRWHISLGGQPPLPRQVHADCWSAMLTYTAGMMLGWSSFFIQSQVPVPQYILYPPDARRMPLTYSTRMLAFLWRICLCQIFCCLFRPRVASCKWASPLGRNATHAITLACVHEAINGWFGDTPIYESPTFFLRAVCLG